MPTNELLKICFVIGPMKDMDRLHRLARQVIEPLLLPYGFQVVTPESGETGAVMNQVLLNLEQADLLVADLTGNNPNVMYELGIYHSFGKPYITVKENMPGPDKSEATPFDIAAFRYKEINLQQVEWSQKAIEPLLTRTIQKMESSEWFENPVTVFYNSPVAEIPTAAGLFKNYCRNFLEELLPRLFMRQEDSNQFIFPVYVHDNDSPYADMDGMVKLNDEERRDLAFELLIPAQMHMTSHSFIKSQKEDNPSFPYKTAKIIKKSRPFYLHYRKSNGQYILADFPTALATLNDSIATRRHLHQTNIEAREWKILEQQELERFAQKCFHFRSKLTSNYHNIEARFNIVLNYRFN